MVGRFRNDFLRNSHAAGHRSDYQRTGRDGAMGSGRVL